VSTIVLVNYDRGIRKKFTARKNCSVLTHNRVFRAGRIAHEESTSTPWYPALITTLSTYIKNKLTAETQSTQRKSIT